MDSSIAWTILHGVGRAWWERGEFSLFCHNLQLLNKYQVFNTTTCNCSKEIPNPLTLFDFFFFSRELITFSQRNDFLNGYVYCLPVWLGGKLQRIFIWFIDDTKWLEKCLRHSRYSCLSVELTSKSRKVTDLRWSLTYYGLLT